MLANAALSGPPLGAFRLVPRSLHAKVDLGVIAALVVVAVLPFLDIDSAGAGDDGRRRRGPRRRLVGYQLRRRPAARRRRAVAPAGSFDSETLGRAAGRLYAKAGKVVRKRPRT